MLQAKKATGAGNVTPSDVLLQGLFYNTGGTDGQILLKNGDTNGNTQLDLDTVGNNQTEDVILSTGSPDDGIPFPDGIHIDTLSNITSVTLIYKNRR